MSRREVVQRERPARGRDRLSVRGPYARAEASSVATAHPWRPFKQPNMFFSVEPSGYHDITSLNEEDDDTPALEALPFRVCHVNAAPKKRKRRAAPAQRKESKKAKHDSSDSEEPDEAYRPSRRISSRPRKGVQRAVKEVSSGDERDVPSESGGGERDVPSESGGEREVLPGGGEREVPCESGGGEREVPCESGGDEREVLLGGGEREVLLGGTARSRRMVMNNVTVQSAYMCL